MSESESSLATGGRAAWREWISRGLPLLIFAFGTLASLAAAYALAVTAQQRDRLAFERRAQRQVDSITRRVETYVALLRGVAGLIASDEDELSIEEFRSFVDRLALRQTYPGVQGLGFSRRVPASEREQFEQSMREQGLDGFRIRPDDPRDVYHAISFLEPLDARNRAAIGYDMFTEPTRRAAMERARDEAEPAATGKVTLVQEIDEQKQPGFLIYLPVYAGGIVPADLAARREGLIGFAYAPFRAYDFFDVIIADENQGDLHFDVYDGPVVRAESQLFESTRPGEFGGVEPEFSIAKPVNVTGRPWTVVLSALPRSEAAVRRSAVAAVIVGGLVVSALLAALAWFEGRLNRTTERDRARLLAANSALAQSEERFRVALKNSPLIVYNADRELRYSWIYHAHPAFAQSEIIGRTDADLLGSDGEELMAFKRSVLESGRGGRREFTLVINGEEEVYDLTAEPLRNESGGIEGLTICAFDITDRRRAESAAREQQTLLKAVADNADVALFIMDDQQHCVFMNPAAEQMTGFTLAELQGRALHDVIHHTRPDGTPYPLAECPIDRAFPENCKEQGEEVFVHKDGRFYTVAYTASPLREAGQIRGTVVEVRDVTREKEAERALAESEQRFRVMANSIPQLAWMARPDGWIFWYNQRWYDYTGTTPEQMEGWGWQSVHDPTQLPRIVEKWQAALAAGDDWEDTFPLRRHDGRMRWHLSRAQPLRDANGAVLLWFGTNTDVTEQRRAAEERERLLEAEQRARADAEQASRLKDEFLASLSHELRTPLNAILGWAQLLRRLPTENEDFVEGLAVIERNARAQARLIEDLLDMSRIVSGKLRLEVQRLDVAEGIDAAVKSATPAAEAKSIRLETVIDSRVGPVRGDAARLQQVVWNLLTNAIKFTPKGGKVQVALERVNSHIEISVSDTGIGIAPEFLPHVFEQFRQADGSTTRQHAGLGLGLAIVKSLVEAHGGSVRAKSPGENQGATFIVQLPLMVLHGELDGQRQHPRLPPPGEQSDVICDERLLAGLTVLVVDDEPDARALLRRELEDCHATVLVAGSAAEAFELLQRERPHVIVSDIGMPEEDGYDLIRRIRQLPPEQGGTTPAAALTAFARSEDRRRALMAGYQTHVAKPVEPAELVAVVASLAGVTGVPTFPSLEGRG